MKMYRIRSTRGVRADHERSFLTLGLPRRLVDHEGPRARGARRAITEPPTEGAGLTELPLPKV